MAEVAKRKLVYVAGPYTHPDPVENTHRAAKVAMAIYEHSDMVPMVPHLSLLWHAICPRTADFWYEIDLDQMAHCQAIVRLPGSSTGADREMEVAADMGLEVIDFHSLPLSARQAWLTATDADALGMGDDDEWDH